MFRRLRPLGEAECYSRCYPGLYDGRVRVIRFPRQRPQALPPISGERLRRLFEERLDAREPGAEAEAA